MKRNMDAILKGIDGTDMFEYKPNPAGGEPTQIFVTLGTIVVNSLLASFDDERQLPGEEKARRYRLASKVYGAVHYTEEDGEVELTAEDIALLKNLIGKGYGPLIVGQCYELLEG